MASEKDHNMETKTVSKMTLREIIDFAYDLFKDGWRYNDYDRLKTRYDLTDEEAGVMTSALRLYE